MTVKPFIGTAILLIATAGEVSASDFYVGAKLRNIDVKFNRDLDESARTLGVLLGYKLASTDWVAFAVEAELAKSVADGELDDPSVYPVKGKWDIKTQAIYGVFTFGTKVYGKVKLGTSRNEISRNGVGAFHKSYKTGPAAGIGVGVNFTPNMMVEVERTFDSGGNDYEGYSIGVNYRF